MEIDNNLIFDVGAFNGDTLDSFLQSGYNIIAIECNPQCIKQLKLKYGRYLRNKQLKIFNCCITDSDYSNTKFYLSSTYNEWCSQNQEISERKQTSKNVITVQTRTLDSIIKETNKIPYYCKIDIEGNDFYAIESLNRNNLPPYISCESECIGHKTYNYDYIFNNIRFKNLALLHAKGYNKFCISLNGWGG